MTTEPWTLYLDDGPVDIEVRKLERAEFQALLEAHPDPDGVAAWDDATFPAALIRASVIPEVGPETAAEWADDTDLGYDLIETCLRLSAPGTLEWARDRLLRDPRLAAEVAYAARAGIPHSRFVGWPQRDQDLALAWAETTRDRCPGCGVPRADMGAWGAWEVAAAACVHCEQLHKAREQVPDAHRHRIHHHLTPGGGD